MSRTKKMPRTSLANRNSLRWPLLVAFGLALAACGKESSELKLFSHTANDIIVPLYAKLDAEAQQLVGLSQRFCQASNDEKQQSLITLQTQWRATMIAWAHVQPVGFGPIEDGNLRWKLQFWPDRKDLTRKKVETLIASDEELTAERVSTASVSVQGLAALEYLLFDERGGALAGYQETQQAGRRCQLLQAITQRVQQVTQQLLNDWSGDTTMSGYADKLSQPSADNTVYPDHQAVLADLLDTLVVGTEVVKRNKLGLPIANGKGARYAKPYRLEAWRSQYSLALMRASTATLEQLYRGNGGFGLTSYLVEHENVDNALLEDINSGFEKVNAQFQLLEGPFSTQMSTQIKQPEYYQQLVELHKRLALLQRSLSKLPERLGISLGFNSNDGD